MRSLAHAEGSWTIVMAQFKNPPNWFCVPEDEQGTRWG